MTIAKPESQGFDAARLARIDPYLKTRYLDSGKLPHAQLLIARGGEIVHFSHQGAAREGGAPTTAEEAARNDALYARRQRQHEEHQRRQPEATALRE